ncbi:MAG: S41 family peptidase, partial [Lachnospiraceae bacterium]
YYKSSEITREDKENGIYKGLFESLEDVYSCYYTPEEYKMLAEQTQGVYYGIGAYVSQDVETGICAISGVIKNSPAEAAGLMEGDLIYKVDGEDMSGLDIDEVVSHIRGEEGTEVALTLVRNGEEIEVKLKRGRVDTPTVESEMLDDGIGYLQITEFDDVTVNQFTENFEELKGQGMKGLIIDLRGNPGGSVTSVCAVAEQLLPKGLIFYMEDKDGNKTEYNCEGADFDLPMVVLVNEYSASAAEILSGAIKDSGIGKLVGKTTFGKGIVQDVIPLQDGSAIKLTVANYYTRGGNDIHLKGIEPDIEVELDTDAYLDDGKDTQLDKAVEVLLGEMGSK